MTDPWSTPGQPAQPVQGYGQPPAGYGQQAGYGAAAGGLGPLGQVRPTGISILLCVVTFGIYVYVYNYKVHSEMQRHSGRGIGGGIALLLTFIAGIAMPFVTPAEVGSLYARRGQPEPVRGWTGLWVIGPAVGGYIILFVTLIASAGVRSTSGTSTVSGDTSLNVAAGIGFFLFLVACLAGGIVWFVKTNGALNRYWESLGASR